MAEATAREDRASGPPMLCATNVLKPPPIKIGRISGNWTLDRAVRITTILGVGGGLLAGLVVGFALLTVGLGLRSFIVSAGVGGGLGYLAVTTSPLDGESLATWLRLSATRRVTSTGGALGRSRVAVGICVVDREPLIHHARLQPGAVEVAAGSVDDRGCRRTMRVGPPPDVLAAQTAAAAATAPEVPRTAPVSRGVAVPVHRPAPTLPSQPEPVPSAGATPDTVGPGRPPAAAPSGSRVSGPDALPPGSRRPPRVLPPPED